MCLNPSHIYNKGYLRLGGMPFIEIPCGKCSECREVKSIDYYLRTMALYHHLFPNNKPSQWSVWFCTFTFAPEHLPYTNVWEGYNPDDVTDNYLGMYPSFDHALLKTFLKSWKQYYTRDLGLPTPHILVTCEYGHKFHRPHYHAVAFIPRQPSSWQEFRNEVTRFWHYGFVKNVALKTIDGKTQERHVVDSIKYVTKYACKEEEWLPFYLDKKYQTSIRPYDLRPRVFTTNGYGAQLEQYLCDADYFRNKFTFDCIKKMQSFHVPTYLRRRFFVQNHYERVEKIVPNEEELKKLPYFCPEKDLKTKYKYFNNSSYKHNYEEINYNRCLNSLSSDCCHILRCDSHLRSVLNICNFSPDILNSLHKVDIAHFAQSVTDVLFRKPFKLIDVIKHNNPHYIDDYVSKFKHFHPLFEMLPEDEKYRQLEHFVKWHDTMQCFSEYKFLNQTAIFNLPKEYLFLYLAILVHRNEDLENKRNLDKYKQTLDRLWLEQHCIASEE